MGGRWCEWASRGRRERGDAEAGGGGGVGAVGDVGDCSRAVAGAVAGGTAQESGGLAAVGGV